MKFWAKLPEGFFGGNIAGTFEGILPMEPFENKSRRTWKI